MGVLYKAKQCERCFLVESIVQANEQLIQEQIKMIKAIQADKEKIQGEHSQLQAKFLQLQQQLKLIHDKKVSMQTKQQQTQNVLLQNKNENGKNIDNNSPTKSGKSPTYKKQRNKAINKENIQQLIPIVMIRKDEQYFSRKRKNSYEEQSLNKQWVKTIDNLGSVTSSKFKQKTLALVKKSIPHELRHIIWPTAIQNQLALTDELYFELLQRRKNSWVPQDVKNQIGKDICRSFSGRTKYETSIGLKQDVTQVLELFHLYRPDVSYIQGMTYPVIVLTLVCGKVKAFNIFSNIILANPFFKRLFTFEQNFLISVARTFDYLLFEYNEEVALNLKSKDIQSQTFLIQWFFTMFSRSLSFESTLKFWDYLLYMGQTVFFRLALGIIDLVGPRLLNTSYEQTIGLIQGFGGFGKEKKLIENVFQTKLTPEKLHKTLERFQKLIEKRETPN